MNNNNRKDCSNCRIFLNYLALKDENFADGSAPDIHTAKMKILESLLETHHCAAQYRGRHDCFRPLQKT